MNNDKFVAYLRRQMKVCPYKHWRKGQIAFNVLYLLRPALANRVRATEHDPFYYDDNKHVADFMKWVHENYNVETDDGLFSTTDES